MLPASADGKRERPFLGVGHRLGRWHIAPGTQALERPPQLLLFQKLAVLAPRYPDASRLPAQQQEDRWLSELARLDRSIGDCRDGASPELGKPLRREIARFFHVGRGHAGLREIARLRA